MIRQTAINAFRLFFTKSLAFALAMAFDFALANGLFDTDRAPASAGKGGAPEEAEPELPAPAGLTATHH